MVLRSTRIAPTILTQVGHEGNPTETNALDVTGTLDGNPVLLIGAGTPDGINNNSAPSTAQIIGGSGGFPATLTGVYAWYDMSQETAWTDGQTVTLLTDMTGNGHNMARVSGEGGTYQTNILNGKAVLRFSANNHRYQFAGAHSVTDPVTFAAVLKPSNIGPFGILANWWGGTTGFSITNGILRLYKDQSLIADGSGSIVMDTTHWYRIVARHGSGVNAASWINNVLDMNAAVVAPDATQQFYIAENNKGSADDFQGDLAEFVIIMGDISSGDRNLLDAYWTAKYAL